MTICRHPAVIVVMAGHSADRWNGPLKKLLELEISLVFRRLVSKKSSPRYVESSFST
jgi:hypothetical protein